MLGRLDCASGASKNVGSIYPNSLVYVLSMRGYNSPLFYIIPCNLRGPLSTPSTAAESSLGAARLMGSHSRGQDRSRILALAPEKNLYRAELLFCFPATKSENRNFRFFCVIAPPPSSARGLDRHQRDHQTPIREGTAEQLDLRAVGTLSNTSAPPRRGGSAPTRRGWRKGRSADPSGPGQSIQRSPQRQR